MGPIEPKLSISTMLKAKNNLENLPTALQKLITSFLPPIEAFKASPASKMVCKLVQDNSNWQRVARSINITLEDPKNVKASLTKLIRSVNQLTLFYLPSDKAKKFLSIPEPFEQNKAIEKYLKLNPDFQKFQQLIGNLVQKRDLNQTEIETVKMFIRNGVLDKVPLSELRDLLCLLADLTYKGYGDTFPQPEIIKMILGRVKETGVAVKKFSDLLEWKFNKASEILDIRHKECIVAFLEGGVNVRPESLENTFNSLLDLPEDQWDIFELFLKNVPRRDLEELKQTLRLTPVLPDDQLLECAKFKKFFGIEKALFAPILSYSKEKVLKDEGIQPHERDLQAFRGAILSLNSVAAVRKSISDSDSPEEIIKIVSDRLPFMPKSIITQIVNAHCNVEANKKLVAATFSRVKEYVFKLK